MSDRGERGESDCRHQAITFLIKLAVGYQRERESDEESLKEREEIFGLVVERERERERERNQKWEERKKREIIKNSIYV